MLCSDVFQTYISTNITKEVEKNEFHCPVCREVIKPIDPTKPREKWARLFPKNRLLISLFESDPQRSECCRSHPGKLVEVFCDTHTELGCSSCLMTRHKDCDVTSLEEFINGGKFKRSCSKNSELLLQYKKLFENTINEVNKNIEELNKSKSDIVEQVKNTRARIEELLCILEEKIVTALDVELKSEIENLSAQVQRCSLVIQDINNTMDQVKTAQTDLPQVLYSRTRGSYISAHVFLNLLNESG